MKAHQIQTLELIYKLPFSLDSCFLDFLLSGELRLMLLRRIEFMTDSSSCLKINNVV